MFFCVVSVVFIFLCLFVWFFFFFFFFFFFNDTATTEIYTLSLHDAFRSPSRPPMPRRRAPPCARSWRSEEHTSELQSRQYLVCRLLLEKKKKEKTNDIIIKQKQNKMANTKNKTEL